MEQSQESENFKNLSKIVFQIAFLLGFSLPGLASGAGGTQAWQDLLDHAQITRQDLNWNESNRQQFGYTSPWAPYFRANYEQSLAIPSYSRIFREVTLSLIDKPDELLGSGLARVGIGVRRSATGELYATEFEDSKKPKALFHAIAALHKYLKRPLSTAQAADLQRSLATVPTEAQAPVAFVVSILPAVLESHRLAFQEVPARDLEMGWREALSAPETDPKKMEEFPRLYRRLLKSVGMNDLMVGGLDLAFAVRRSKELLPESPVQKSFQFRWQTPAGWIVMGDSRASNFDLSQALLIYDFGGDDTYTAGGGTRPGLPASVIVDVAGNDLYVDSVLKGKGAEPAASPVSLSAKRKQDGNLPLFGGGVFGYGMVADFAGDDKYSSFRQTQGRGFFGVGLLWDVAGNDVYDSYSFAQGSGEFGVGLLLDRAGTDRYLTFHQSQGFGSVQGVGYLIDTGTEADFYLANTTLVDFPAEVDSKHNHSMSQGVGFGFRGDLVDGVSQSGGVGVLLDEGGSNEFIADFFSQGHAYWYAVGLLISGEGNDVFRAGKYAQGTSAHFGVGILLDRGGNDRYMVEQELGIGHGHDYGIGFFIDDSGDDVYEAPELSLGCASAQGRGFFWDRSGDDVYTAPAKNSLGCAAYRILDEKTFRRRDQTIGLFLDTGGRNKFVTDIAGPRKVTTSGKWKNVNEGIDVIQPTLLGYGLVTSAPQTSDPK